MARLPLMLGAALAALLLAFSLLIGPRATPPLIDAGTQAAAPFLHGFIVPETAPEEVGGYTFQWSRPHARVRLPAVSAADRWLISLRALHRPDNGPARITALFADGHSVDLGLRPGMRRYHLFGASASELHLLSDTSALDDAYLRERGIAVERIEITRLGGGWLPAPWLALTAALLGAFMSSVFIVSGLRQHDAFLAMLAAALLGAWGLMTSYVHAVAALPMLCALATGLALGAPLLARALRPRLGDLAGPAAALCALALLTKGAGIAYPGFFPTDTQFHINRLQLTAQGELFLLSEGQDQTFPYPVGIYALLQPFLALWPNARWVSQLGGLVADTATIPLLMLLLKPTKRAIALWAGVLYALMPAGLVQFYQNPLAQIIGQWLGVVYVGALVAALMGRWRGRAAWLGLVVLGFAATQGHFGVFLNLWLMAVLLVLLNPRWAWEQRRWLATWPVASLLAALVYYSAWISLFQSELGNLTSRPEDPAALRWYFLERFIWDLGLIGHYAVIFAVTGTLGLVLLLRHERAQSLGRIGLAMVATMVVLCIAIIAVFFGATRQMIFAYPALVVGSAVVWAWLEERRWGFWLARLIIAAIALRALADWAALFALQDQRWFLL